MKACLWNWSCFCFESPCFAVARLYGESFYARDPVGETSVLSCFRLAQGEASERARVRREVFPSGGTA